MAGKAQCLEVHRVPHSSLRLTWVDDCFDNAADDQPLPFREIRSLLRNAKKLSQYRKDNVNVSVDVLLRLLALCREYRVAFRVANFEYLEATKRETLLASNDYYLIDLNYTGTSGERCYGLRLAQGKNLPQERFRFLTRFPDAMEEAQDSAFDAVPISKRAAILERRLREWLNLVVVHEDPLVSQSLSFYSGPWQGEGVYPNKWHFKKHHNDCAFPIAIAGWLDLKAEAVDLESSKALCIWRPDGFWGGWHVGTESDRLRNGYGLSGNVLAAVLKRLQVNVQGINPKAKYYMPVDPCLPFLLSLCVFVHKAGDGAKVDWRRLGTTTDVVVNHVMIHYGAPDWSLRRRYYNKGARGQGLAIPLDNLLKCKLDLNTKGTGPNDEWKRLFAVGTECPPCSVFFTPGTVHLFWPSKPER